MTIGKRIAEKRSQSGLTQASLASSLNVSTAYISQIESDIRKPSYKLLIDMAHKLNTSVEYIVSGTATSGDTVANNLVSFCFKQLPPEKQKKVLDYLFVVNGTKRYNDFPFLGSPVEYANFLVKEYNVQDIPVDVFSLAEQLGVDIVMAKIEHEGVLYKNHDRPLIILDSDENPSGRDRFTLALLLGNLVIPWHLHPVYYRAKQKKSLEHEEFYEIEARQFAGELLLPTVLVKKDFKQITPSIGSLEELAYNKYKTSLGAVGHKYTELFGETAAYVTSENGKITRKYDSKFQFRLPEDLLPGSFAYDLLTNPPSRKETRSGYVDPTIWGYDGSKKLILYEESMVDPKQNVVVTLLLLQKRM